MSRVLLAGLVTLTGCAPDLTATEQRQRELERELAELDREIAALKTSMEEAGVPVNGGRRAKGKAKAKAKAPPAEVGRVEGHQSPRTERTADAGLTIARTGTPPALDLPASPERSENECGYKLEVPGLRAISDYPLNNRGLGKSSPLVLSIDGRPLAAHAFPRDFSKQCAGAFRHAGTVILFSPPDSPALDGRDVTLSLDPQVPMPRGDDGRPMYWVYPGTELVFTLGRWDPSWGPAVVDIGALVIGDGDATFAFDGTEETQRGPARLSHALEGGGPHTIAIRSPAEGPYVLLDVLTVGNPENAVVVTGGAAWDAQRR